MLNPSVWGSLQFLLGLPTVIMISYLKNFTLHLDQGSCLGEILLDLNDATSQQG